MRGWWLLVLCAGCGAAAGEGGRDLGALDASSPTRDFAVATDDLATISSANDLAEAVDLSVLAPQDLASARDLTVSADLAPPPDLALVPPGDMSPSGFGCPVDTFVGGSDSFVIDDSAFYWVGPTAIPGEFQATFGIYRTPMDGGVPTLLVDALETQSYEHAAEQRLAVDATYVYWATGGANGDSQPASIIGRVPKIGGASTIVASAPSGSELCNGWPPNGHVVQLTFAPDDTLYFVEVLNYLACQESDAYQGQLLALAPGGTTLSAVAFAAMRHIAVDDAAVYWDGLSSAGAEVGVSRLPYGQSASVTLSTIGTTQALAVDVDRVYFADAAGSIYAVPKGGGTTVRLYDATAPSSYGGGDLGGLVVARGRVYWGIMDGPVVAGLRSMKVDGSDLRLLTSDSVFDVHADASYVYWSSSSINRSCLL